MRERLLWIYTVLFAHRAVVFHRVGQRPNELLSRSSLEGDHVLRVDRATVEELHIGAAVHRSDVTLLLLHYHGDDTVSLKDRGGETIAASVPKTLRFRLVVGSPRSSIAIRQ